MFIFIIFLFYGFSSSSIIIFLFYLFYRSIFIVVVIFMTLSRRRLLSYIKQTKNSKKKKYSKTASLNMYFQMYYIICKTNCPNSNRYFCKKNIFEKNRYVKYIIRKVSENSKLIINYSAIKIVNLDPFYRHQLI